MPRSAILSILDSDARRHVSARATRPAHAGASTGASSFTGRSLSDPARPDAALPGALATGDHPGTHAPQQTSSSPSAASHAASERATLRSTHPTATLRAEDGALATIGADLGVATLDGRVVEYANLDHGATAPALVAAAHAVDATLRTYGSVHRGAGRASQLTTRWYEEARQEVATFVGAREDDVAEFTRNTSDALNLLAHCLPGDTQVFVFRSMHHAALLPWSDERTTRLPIPRSHDEAERTLRTALGAFRASSDAPALVLITGACNVTGEIWPIERLAATAREHDARTALDAAQLAPHRRVDIDAWGIDYVALSGHKAYAPYGSGALVGRRDWLDAAPPYFRAGGASHRVSEDASGAGDVDWAPAPARHEGGTPNAVGAIALAAAARTLAEHREVAEAREEAAHAIIRSGLAAIDGVRVVELFDEGAVDDRHDDVAPGQGASDNVGVTTFTVDGYDPTLVAQILSDEHGIAVRDGRFCAHLLCDARLGDGATGVRASIGLATTAEHARRLVDAVRALVTHGPTFDYTHTPGLGWSPIADRRDLSEPRPW